MTDNNTRTIELELPAEGDATFSNIAVVDVFPEGIASPEALLAKIAIFRGEDGALVVDVETREKTGHVRVNLNDGDLFDGNPETDES